MDIIGSGNITSDKLNRGGLHLNPRGLHKLAVNFIRRIRKSATTLNVIVRFHKASSFDFHINFRSFTNLGNIENSDESAINQLNGTCSEGTLKNDALNGIRKKNPNYIIMAYLTLSSLVFTKRSYIPKQTCSFQLQVCLSMYDLLVNTRR